MQALVLAFLVVLTTLSLLEIMGYLLLGSFQALWRRNVEEYSETYLPCLINYHPLFSLLSSISPFLYALSVGDQILSVNGISLEAVTHEECIEVLKNSGTRVEIVSEAPHISKNFQSFDLLA